MGTATRLELGEQTLVIAGGVDASGTAYAERMATNAPIQGTAADILKMAMIALERNLTDDGGGARMLLTVHDEIVIEVPEGGAPDVAGIVKEVMENVFPLAVPLAVDAHYGKSWFDAKE